ncbi:MAG: HAD family hydrolase [Acidobacteriota bacterium]
MGGDAAGSRAEDRTAPPDLGRIAGARVHPDRPALIPPPDPLRAVLFDWDGTLLDSAEASFRCYRRLFEPYGIDFTAALFAGTYAPDWYRTYEGVGLGRDRWSEADTRWLEIYREEACALRGGVGETLARFAAAGVRAALVTSGTRSRVEGDLRRLGLAEAFDRVVCGEDAVRKKPDPEALHLALDGLDVPAPEAAYVGDSPEDVEMARAAGVFSVGLAGGFPNADALRRAAPDAMADDLLDVAALLLPRP